MGRIWLFAAFAALLMAVPVTAQDFNASEPSGPRTGQNDAKAEIDRLKAIIRELEREIARLREGSAPVEESTPQKNDLLGAWLGSVSCGRRQFSVTFSVTEQFGKVAKGKWDFSGAATGTDEAQLSPMPTDENPDAYMIVTAKPNIFDYAVKIDGNTISGKSTQQRCQIHLERG